MREHRRDHGSQKWVFLKASLGEALELRHKLESTVRMSTEPNPQCFFSSRTMICLPTDSPRPQYLCHSGCRKVVWLRLCGVGAAGRRAASAPGKEPE